MQTLAGAVVILGGSIVVAAATLGHDIARAHNRGNELSPGALAGAFVLLVGLAVLIRGLMNERHDART